MPHSETYVNGVWHPSVTTIMGSQEKPWIRKWAERWGQRAIRKTKLAQLIGTEVHRCIESYTVSGGYVVAIPEDENGRFYPSLVARIQGMMKSFEVWAVNTHGIIDHAEKKVISRKYIYSGTVDAIGQINKDDLGLENGH